MRNAKGFSFIEILISVSLILFLAALCIPISSKLHIERKILSERRQFTQLLHDELQTFIWSTENSPALHFVRIKKEKEIQISYIPIGNKWKGCATWINAKHEQEESCLYGISEK